MVKSFPTKTRRAGRFFGSQSRRSKALRKGRTAGQSSAVGYRLRRYVSILQMRQILLAPWPFRIPRPRKSPANALVQDAPARRSERGRAESSQIGAHGVTRPTAARPEGRGYKRG